MPQVSDAGAREGNALIATPPDKRDPHHILIHTVPGIITNINKKSIFARIRNREVRYAHA